MQHGVSVAPYLSTGLSATSYLRPEIGWLCPLGLNKAQDMSWNNQDNKHYRGPIDRVFVSMSEAYEVSYFIDEYLRTRGYGLTEENRRKVGAKLEKYPGRAPWQREDLNAHLDAGWKA
jgi:hypothetical protein